MTNISAGYEFTMATIKDDLFEKTEEKCYLFVFNRT